MPFTTITQVKHLNGLWFQPPFSYDPCEKMEKLIGVTIRTIEENSLRLITMKTYL